MSKIKNFYIKKWQSIAGLLIVAFFVFVSIFPLSKIIYGYGGDRTCPQIRNVVVSEITSTTAVITWETDELSLTWIRYGLFFETEYKSINYVFFHSITLENLLPETSSYY